MSLSVDLASQFAKLTKGDKKQKSEATVYGKTVEYNGRMYVQIDGSELLTPVTTTTDMVAGERVTILIKNHTATVTGNITSPSARTGDVKAVDNRVSELGGKISEFETIIADQVTTEQLNAERARIDELVSTDVIIKKSLTAAEADIDTLQTDNVSIKESLTAQSADIETIKADNVTIKETLTAQSAEIDSLKTSKLDAAVADITYATIGALDAVTADMTNLESTFGDFKALATDKMTANEADIAELQTNKLSASDIEGKFANIDFSNIGKAAMEHFYSESGLIQNVVVGDATITGELVGVTISGNLIEGNTVKAEKLVIKGNDGLYYKLNTDGVTTEAEQTDYNSLDGQVIKAKSITATKISVDDLVAFDATIGGFNITDSAIYSGVKESVDNTTSGVYMDKTGQMAIGDASSFIKYYKDQNGDYRLEISAQSVLMSTSSTAGEENIKSVEDVITELSETTSTTANDLSNYISTTNTELENLQDQIDGSITTWFQEYEPTVTNHPASEWATIYDKNVHLGDLFYNTLTGYCYRWQVLNNVYSWNLVKDVDITKAIADAAKAQNTADKKRRVFVSTPTVPYDVGDLWVQGSSGDIMRCNTAKTSSQSYNSTDWVKASKYTDDTKANAAQAAANTAQSGVDALKTRMSSAETEISQNKEAIALRATKTELTETLSGYYTKEQSEAAITVKANEISQNVSNTYATKTALDTTNSNVTAAKQAADNAQADVDAIEVRVTNAETRITQNSEDILLRATKTEVATAKSEAISTAASDATTKANNAKSSAISTAASDATTKADNALASAKTYADAQIKVSADSITSTVNSVKTTAETANNYVTAAKNNYGYQYKKTITIYGDSSTYYPVLIIGGDQYNVREIMVKRSFSDTAPADWNGHGTTKGISLLLRIKCSFGAWGGVKYNWVIDELDECYGNVFAGASHVMDYMGFVIFLRGGGETGATYHIFSDQQLDRSNYMNGYSVRICYDQEQIGWSGGTADNPTYSWNAPAPRELTGDVLKEIASKKYIDVATSASEDAAEAQAFASSNLERIRITESIIQQLSDSISMLVVDESGESLMVQEGDNWTFNMGSYHEMLSSISTNLDALTSEVGDAQNTVDILQQSVNDISVLSDYVKITTYNDQPCIELGESENNFKLRITNTEIQFIEGTVVPAYLSNEKLYIEQAEITGELQQGGFSWKKRSNGNLGLIWKGES